MSLSNVSLVQQRYDQIAHGYDDLWSRHVALPQRRLTRDLQLAAGERLMDLACGTGGETVDMLTRVVPGEVIAVDCSEGMLRAAARLAAAQGHELTLMQCTAEEAVARAAPTSIDVVSVRFALAYIEWRPFFIDIARVLRPGGRLGILSSLATSLPQAREIVAEVLRDFGHPPVSPNTPENAEVLLDAMSQAGLAVQNSWVHPFRIWFDSGPAATRWMRESGYVTHPQMERVPRQLLSVILDIFGRRLDKRFREARGVPLDFELAGVIAAKE
ncbi:MAG: methyltransferase domain-containing protein [Polyangiaceae bacterium]|nr:methyltransferase domain-containing protein [Polyangiaceae bacterium]